jgi:DNA repair protein RadC
MKESKKYLPINDWPQEDRPREKLLKHGEHTLSDSELLAIILRTGIKGESALDLARRILREFKTFRALGRMDSGDWKELKGMGNAKICQIKAAIEIGRRFGEEKIKEKRSKIKFSQDIIAILMPRMRDLKKEVFKVLLLNSQNRVIDIIEVEEGTVNQAKPIVREVYQKALQQFASFIICVHNHPSGNPKPSQEDKEFTRALVKAGEVLLITCLDHIIIGNGAYFSFSDEGLM